MQQSIKILFHIYMKLGVFRAASCFAYVEGCWTCSCWTLLASNNYNAQQPSTYAKPEAASAVLGS
jgi:hypothetical protein